MEETFPDLGTHPAVVSGLRRRLLPKRFCNGVAAVCLLATGSVAHWVWDGRVPVGAMMDPSAAQYFVTDESQGIERRRAANIELFRATRKTLALWQESLDENDDLSDDTRQLVGYLEDQMSDLMDSAKK